MTDQISHGTAEMLREVIAEHLSLAQLQAQLGTTYAAIGDDTGLEYAMRNLVAYNRAALATLADLKQMKSKGARS